MQIRELRKQKGKTQEEMANELGIKKQNLQNYEIGKREPSIEIMIKLSNYFDCTLDELVGNEKKTSFTTSPTKQRALDIFNQLTDNDYLVLIGYMEHLLLEKEQKRKQRINTIIEDINRGE